MGRHQSTRISALLSSLEQTSSSFTGIDRIATQVVIAFQDGKHLEEILTVLMEQFAPRLRERNQQVVFQGIDALPYFSGDRDCLFDVFAELLENAVKFTPDGGEMVIAARVTNRRALTEKRDILAHFNPSFHDQMGDAGYLQVEVRDSGVGIASGIRNAAMRRSTSDSRARSEISKILDTYVSVLNKDYQASTTAGVHQSSWSAKWPWKGTRMSWGAATFSGGRP